ncbi:hypothetical protein Tco_0836964 [Tanacetum coccineum]
MTESLIRAQLQLDDANGIFDMQIDDIFAGIPKPVISEPPSKRQRVDRDTSPPSDVPAASTHHVDDPDSAGGGSFNPAGSATPMTGYVVPDTAGGTLGTTVTAYTVPTSAAMDSAGSHHELGISPFADSADILAEILFRGQYISGAGVVIVDKLLDDEIVDPRVKVETISESASSPPRSRRKHIVGCGSDVTLYGIKKKPVERDVNLWGLDLWRDVNLLCQSLHSDDVEDFWRTQDEWVVSSWKLYPRSSVHVLDLTNGKTVYMFVGNVYPIRATLLERMLRHRLTVPPSYCRDVVVAGNVIQTVQAGLRESYECLASAPLACTARQMVFSSPWLTAKKESGSPLQTALVCNSNPLIAVKTFSNPLYGCDSLPKTVRVFQFTLDSRSEKLDWLLLHQDWKLLLRDVAASFDSAVHRVHAVSFDAAVASTVSAACCVAAGYIVSAGLCCCCLLCSCCFSILFLREDLSRNLELTESKPSLGEDFVPADSSSNVPADYVSAGHECDKFEEIESTGRMFSAASTAAMSTFVAKVIVGGICTLKVLSLIASQVIAFASPSTQFVIGTWLLTMSVLVNACSLTFDPHASTLTFDPHAFTLALKDASDAYALANIHALAFLMSFQEGFTSLSLHPDFEPQNLPLSLYSSDK